MNEVFILKECKDKITEPKDIFKRVKKINIDYSQENFLIIFLNTANTYLGCEVLFKGGLNACLICPKTLFRKALLMNSDKIIIAHNHPSDNLTPSKEDIEIYRKLQEAGELLNLKVVDSIIFNKKEYYSLND